jgi:hypothetical protein
VRDPVFQLLNEIALERNRQEEVEGHTLEQEDAHDFAEMARAAAAYALAAALYSIPIGIHRDICRARANKLFPTSVFGEMANLPPRETYIRACALLIAEIERIDRRDGRHSPLDRTDARSRRFGRPARAPLTGSPAAAEREAREEAAYLGSVNDRLVVRVGQLEAEIAQLTGQEATDGLGGPAPAGGPRIAMSHSEGDVPGLDYRVWP